MNIEDIIVYLFRSSWMLWQMYEESFWRTQAFCIVVVVTILFCKTDLSLNHKDNLL